MQGGEGLIIRLLEDNDRSHVENIMASHPLQFPKFIIDKYSLRWSDFLEKQDHKICSYYVAHNDIVLGHAGYIFDVKKRLYEIVGVAVHKESQRKGIGKELLDTICNQVHLLGGKMVILKTLGHVGNENTLTFYRNIGYEQVDFEKDFFETGYHRVTFVKKWC